MARLHSDTKIGTPTSKVKVPIRLSNQTYSIQEQNQWTT